MVILRPLNYGKIATLKRLDLYIIGSTIKPFFGALLVTTSILILDRVFDLMDLIIKKGIPLDVVFQVMLYSLPFILSMTIPMSVFVGSLVAFGRLAQDLEILALLSSGVSLNRIAFPVVFVSIFITLFMFWFNDRIVPESNYKLKNLILDIAEKRPTSQIRAGTFSQVGNFWIYVGKKDDRSGEIWDVIIQKLDEREMQTVVSGEGVMFIDQDRNLNFVLGNGYIHDYDRRSGNYKRVKFSEYRISIPLNDELIRKQREWRSDREKTVGMFLKELKDLEGNYRNSKDEGIKRRINSIKVELHKKFSMPFASIIFVFLAMYIGFILRRGGYGPAFGVSFFVFVIYYIFLISGEDLGKRGIIPPELGMWWANYFYMILTLLIYKFVINQ